MAPGRIYHGRFITGTGYLINSLVAVPGAIAEACLASLSLLGFLAAADAYGQPDQCIWDRIDRVFHGGDGSIRIRNNPSHPRESAVPSASITAPFQNR